MLMFVFYMLPCLFDHILSLLSRHTPTPTPTHMYMCVYKSMYISFFFFFWKCGSKLHTWCPYDFMDFTVYLLKPRTFCYYKHKYRQLTFCKNLDINNDLILLSSLQISFKFCQVSLFWAKNTFSRQFVWCPLCRLCQTSSPFLFFLFFPFNN